MRRLAALALALTLASTLAGGAQDEVVPYSGDDVAMNTAIETGQSHLGQVLTATISDVGVGHPALSLKVAFPVEAEDMVYDWGLVGPGGKIFGHHTTRVLIDALPEEQAAPIREALSDDPLPEAWR